MNLYLYEINSFQFSLSGSAVRRYCLNETESDIITACKSSPNGMPGQIERECICKGYIFQIEKFKSEAELIYRSCIPQ